MINSFELFSQYNHPIAMSKCCLLISLALCVCFCNAQGQTSKKTRFRLGANIAFVLSHIANNDVGVGGTAGAEKAIGNNFSAELEASYTYFTGDKLLYLNGDNKAWSLPVLAGVKLYAKHWLYGSLRAGAIAFKLNSESSTHIRPAYGLAAGINLPKKNNRLNMQLGYTAFHFGGRSRGYATLAAGIIIN